MKRFTETEKWRDTWFRRLPPIAKLAFIYVVDNCDAAGVWDPDYDLADFTIGEKVAWPTIIEAFGERLELLPDGKWHLTRFVEFQYGELTEDCRPHAKVMQLLRAHGIPFGKGIKKVSKATILDKDNTGQGQDKKEAATPEDIYAAYPRKEAKQDALRAISKAIEANKIARLGGGWSGVGHFADYLLARTQAYAAAVATWIPDDRKFVPHPATWFNRGSYDDDPTLWERKAPQHLQPERARIGVNVQ